MRAFVFGLSLVVTSPALADQAADIAAHAGKCWSIPATVDRPYNAEFDVIFDNNGFVTDATVTKYTPDGEQGKRVVLSATRAMQNCGPYPGATGTVHVVMDPKVLFGSQKPIDPFKN